MKPTATMFQTQKQELRNAIEECSSHSKSFQEFQSLLFEKYQISVIEERGRYRNLHPNRDKRITEKALGTQYGKEHLEQIFLRKDPITILYVRSHLRLVVNLQKNVKAMQSPGYAHRVKISNLQEMANTIIYVQEHGYNTQTELKNAFSKSQKQLDQATDQLMEMNADLKSINRQIHYTGQYFAQKAIYTEFLKAKNKGRFWKEHTAEIHAYEEARDWLKSFYPDGKMLPIKTLKEQKASLQEQIDQQKSSIQSLKDLTQDLRTVDKNVEAILLLSLNNNIENVPMSWHTRRKNTPETALTVVEGSERLLSPQAVRRKLKSSTDTSNMVFFLLMVFCPFSNKFDFLQAIKDIPLF